MARPLRLFGHVWMIDVGSSISAGLLAKNAGDHDETNRRAHR
jgi:hypothetical protein